MAYSFFHLHDEAGRRPGSEAVAGANAGARAEPMVPRRPSAGNELGLLPAAYGHGLLLAIDRFSKSLFFRVNPFGDFFLRLLAP